MKKILFVFIFLVTNTLLFSQSEIMQFLSMGFNVQHQQSREWSYYNYYTYFFYGYEDYSEAFVYNDSISLSTGTLTFYPSTNIVHGFSPTRYRRYSGQNNSIGYEWEVPTQGYTGREQKFENDRLVYWALTEGKRPYTTEVRIEQNAQRIIIYFQAADGINFQDRYYNISRTELLDMFLKKYVELICIINEMINNNDYIYKNRLYEIVNPVFQGRTARELAIFRNCLYAIKGYRFANSTWIEFFNKYLDGYNGRYTNDEVTAMFTENEKWLLDLVIQSERRR